jgi:hypothetical protein
MMSRSSSSPSRRLRFIRTFCMSCERDVAVVNKTVAPDITADTAVTMATTAATAAAFLGLASMIWKSGFEKNLLSPNWPLVSKSGSLFP